MRTSTRIVHALPMRGLIGFAIATMSACILEDEPAYPGITTAPEELIVAVGDTARLTARVFVPGQPNATPEVSWRSDSQAASVDANGLVTGQAPGELAIIGSVSGLGVQAQSTVVVIEQFWWLAAGRRHTCGLGSNASLYCWGDNAFGQLGDGTTTQRTTPTEVGGPADWGGVRNFGSLPQFSSRRLATGDDHTCVVSTDTELANPRPGLTFCWGRGSRGQLGNGSTSDRPTPAPVVGGVRFESLAAGADHTCGIEWNTFAMYCWGANDEGRLGDGTTSDRTQPVPVASGETFTLVSVSRHTCGLAASGTAYCWGPNESGQLGDGTADDRSTPTAVSGGHRFTVIAAGDRHTCGVGTDQLVYCWGSNGEGQLGDGTTTESMAPVAIQGSLTFVLNTLSLHSVGLLAGGGGEEGTAAHHACAVADEGFSAPTRYVPFCWGSNGSGQLGTGSTDPATSPSAVTFDPLDVLSIHAGELHTCALTYDGAAFCWGSNDSGQLGDGTRAMSAVPVRVASLR